MVKETAVKQCTAELFVIESKLYDDVIGMQCSLQTNVKSESINQIPWAILNKDTRKKNLQDSNSAAKQQYGYKRRWGKATEKGQIKKKV